jgi:hypothetical protein
MPTDYYWSVVLPFVETDATEWHPTSRDFAPITRGAFATPEDAHAWAREKLGSSAVYSLARYRGDS